MTRVVASARSDESVQYTLKIDSQPLGTALQELAKQCDVQIVFFSRITQGLQAPALNARYTIAGALEILLSGSHLTFQAINPKTIQIRPLTATDPLEDLAAEANRSSFLYGCCFTSGGIIRSKGVDLELNGQMAPGWLIGAGYTYNVNYGFLDFDPGGPTPRHLFKLWTSKQLGGGLLRWTVGGTLQALGSSFKSYISCPVDARANCIGPDTLFNTAQGSYAIVGLRASRAIAAHWRVALNANNIFDRSYYQSPGTPFGGGWYGNPSNFLVRIDARY